MSDEDLNAVDLPRVLSKLPEGLPIPDGHDARRSGFDRLLAGENWYSSLKQSMVSWYEDLEPLDGSVRRGRSLEARVGWNRSTSPQGMLWITEALGEDTATLNGVAEEASHRKHLTSQCSAIRRSIPWTRIAKLLAAYREETQGYFKKGMESLAKGVGSKLTGWLSDRHWDC